MNELKTAQNRTLKAIKDKLREKDNQEAEVESIYTELTEEREQGDFLPANQELQPRLPGSHGSQDEELTALKLLLSENQKNLELLEDKTHLLNNLQVKQQQAEEDSVKNLQEQLYYLTNLETQQKVILTNLPDQTISQVEELFSVLSDLDRKNNELRDIQESQQITVKQAERYIHQILLEYQGQLRNISSEFEKATFKANSKISDLEETIDLQEDINRRNQAAISTQQEIDNSRKKHSAKLSSAFYEETPIPLGASTPRTIHRQTEFQSEIDILRERHSANSSSASFEETPIPFEASTPKTLHRQTEFQSDQHFDYFDPVEGNSNTNSSYSSFDNTAENPVNMADENRVINALLTRNVDVNSLPKFGESLADDIVDFLARLELALQFYDLTNQQKARIIPLILKGRAYTFYLTRPQATQDDYQLMRAALLEEFNAPELQYRKRQELHGIRQNNEPIATYLARVEKLSQNLNVADQTRLDIMIAGLDPHYRKFIQLKQPAGNSPVNSPKPKQRNRRRETNPKQQWLSTRHQTRQQTKI